MAVVYETGTATDPVNLLDKLEVFAIAQGSITVDKTMTVDGDYEYMSLSFGSGFFSVGYKANTGGFTPEAFVLTQATSFADAGFGNEANATTILSGATQSSLVPVQSITEYHFFYNPGGMLFVTMQLASGNWTHFGMGDIVKYGTYTGGSLITGNYIAGGASTIDDPYSSSNAYFLHYLSATSGTQYGDHLRVDHNASPKFYGFRGGESTSTRGYLPTARDYDNAELYMLSNPSSTTQATTLRPVRFLIENGVTPNKCIPVGELADIRILNMKFFSPGDVFDTDWFIFPIGAKRDWDIRDNNLNTGLIGVAIRWQNG